MLKFEWFNLLRACSILINRIISQKDPNHSFLSTCCKEYINGTFVMTDVQPRIVLVCCFSIRKEHFRY